MSQHTTISSRFTYKNLTYVLIFLQILCFFLPLSSITLFRGHRETTAENIALSCFTFAKGITVHGSRMPSNGLIYLLLVPSVLILLIWFLEDLNKIRTYTAVMICLIASVFQFIFSILELIFSAGIRQLGNSGNGKYLGSYFASKIGFGVILAWFLSLALMILFSLFTQKLNPHSAIVRAPRPVHPADSFIFCPNCGFKLASDTNYCIRCGTKIR